MRRRLAALTAILALAMVATVGTPALTQDGATLRVRPDGTGDHETIASALEAASPGDTILIAPGRYVENLHIDKPVTLRGDGPRDEVVIAPDPRRPFLLEVPDADPVTTHIFVDGVDATLEHLSLEDSVRVQSGLMLTGGEPILRDIISPRITGVNGDIDATLEGSELGRIILMGDEARMTVRDNTIGEGVVIGMGATASVTDNLILELPIDLLEGSNLDARGNTFRPEDGAPAVWVTWANAAATIVDNDIEGGGLAIMVEHADSAVIEGNAIRDAAFGIQVIETDATIRGNTITDSGDYGIHVSGNGATVEDNVVSRGRVGILASTPNGFPPGAPRLQEPTRFTGNTVTGASHYGVLVADASPVISGNTICAHRQALRLEDEASPRLGTNEICEPGG